MGNRNSYQSITIYKDMAPQILELEKVEAGEILQAIMRYSCYGEDTDMSQYDRFVRSLWKTIKLKLDAGEAHDKEISKTNSSNAKKRWEKEKGNATGCDRTTITDTVTGTNSSTLTISSTVTNTDTEHADADSGSADRLAGAAAAEGAAPQDADLFSVKQLLATAKKNKVNLTKEGIQVFHEEMQDSGWIQLGIRLPYKLKSNNYSELIVVNVADGWSERLRSYLGRSRQRIELHQQMHKKSVVTTNGEKSAEVIVPLWLQT